MPWTIRNIFQSTLKLNPERKTPPDSPPRRLDKIIPFAGVNTCLFQVSMKGVTQAGVTHRVNILVTSLDIKRKPVEDKAYFKFTDKDGDYWIQKPNPSTGEFRIRCSCHDHYYTWGIWNFFNDTIFGNKPRPYKRKTPPPPKGYPYRNPKKYVGMCKHIIHAVKFLEQQGYFK